MARPALPYLHLHGLEVENALRQRLFHEQRIRPGGERSALRRERDAAFSRLHRLIERGALAEAALDLDRAMDEARALSKAHTERLGARAIDVLHVACARSLGADLFLTCDRRQSVLGKAARLRTRWVGAS
ncbi:MAG: PIN domain-containing protein [Verrucomicrobiales bacterium]|nr:PIN domain-containing protein [Verrucomicrobiales bacterium]